ncbi:MAG: homoserine kinase [bacterium]|nr:homoserine kinase [bacterium]
MTAWTVHVPCSTSNLGPGFDLLGLALSLHLEIEAREAPGGEHRIVEATGEALAWPRAQDNLVLRAFDEGRRRLGAEPCGLHVRAHSAIPLMRGLGSSGAAIAAGLLLAQATTGGAENEVPRELLRAGCDLDGHPDNSTASLLGGCTLALPTADGLEVVRQPLDASIGIAVAWPSSRVPTARARAVLPASVAFEDAVENPRRLAVLLEGLRTGNGELLALGAEDRLHVRYRLPLIPGATDALAAARDAGAWLATISGSGSTLLALAPHERTSAVATALRDGLARADEAAVGHVVEAVRARPRVRAV